jgi:hypothetical protein
MSGWQSLGCDKNTGIKTEVRFPIIEPSDGGAACPVNTRQTPCLVNCEVSPWGPTGACDASFPFLGSQWRSRTVKYAPRNGGAACPPLTEATGCAVDCVMSEWQDVYTGWNCWLGQRAQTRRIIQQPLNGGEACPELLGWQRWSGIDERSIEC